jgi:hypothetical protein
MTIEDLLLDTNARIVFDDKWMVRSKMTGDYIVYSRGFGERTTKTLYAGNLDKALEILQGGE